MILTGPEIAREVARGRIVNAGGGIGVNYADLDRQFDLPTFAAGLGPRAARAQANGTSILFECGRYVTAAHGSYVVEVLDLKRSHDAWFVLVRGGTHHFRLPVSWQHSHPFRVIRDDAWRYPFARPEVVNVPVTMVGELCTPKDVMARDIPVARIRVGDLIEFVYAGAYGWSISHHDFLLHPHPEHVYVDE